MRRAHGPVPSAQRSAPHVLDAQQLQPPDHAHDIENRIHGAHLVQVNLLGRHAVDLALGGRDGHEGGVGSLTDAIRRPRPGNERTDLRDVTPMRLWRNREVHLPADELSAQHFPDLDGDVR